MKRSSFAYPLLAATFGVAALGGVALAGLPGVEPGEDRPGGAATARVARDVRAFTHPSANLSLERRMEFRLGDAIFRKLWASSPSSTTASDGLGPLYNARSCQSCHLRDGRGRVPLPGETAVSLFLRLSVPPRDDAERARLASGEVPVLPEPTYGTQLQNAAVHGLTGEGRMVLTYAEETVELAGGETVSLRRPAYTVADLAYGPMAADVMISPRMAPPMIGLGLLEAIPEADILAGADPDDVDGDGISGRPNLLGVEKRLGRFGWKAGQPDVAAQSAHALAGDIGLSSPAVPFSHGDCTAAQTACLSAPTGDDPVAGVEVTQPVFDMLTFYTRHLAVPARPRAADADVLAGKAKFAEAGCAACHRPSFVTAADATDPELAGQRIYPYTDLLLHDMGPDLADDRPEARASGSEWRTPPLWGIGLTQQVSGRTEFLHDGRARSLTEAILWHGGEAAAARNRFIALTPEDRRLLVEFLRSL
ncbi:di-heme oxidoredictase family protein [Zavarzinia aquatilis]|uniref:di-heme oxidoreductase family protein n=1 Tax=Zavarzinia aquatilis TaxID=2211142 RepID=UPI001A9C57CB|nr:di-heme oxidoredictase family protein [Zavarzinia aquatilis]